MSPNTREVLAVSELPPEGAKLSRIWEWFVVAAVALLFMGAIHLHVMLSVGDWDMFVDWKDRQFWVLVVPVSMMMIPAALQGVFWHYFRLPIGMTLGATLLLVATWITRVVGWHIWGYFPFTMGVPSTILVGALACDAILLIVRSSLLTATFGGFLVAFLFFPSNWPALASYFLAVEHQGMVASVADMIGYVFPRSGTPEYIRIIERGTLRTYEGSTVWVSAFFAGFVCIFMHMIWWQIGLAFSTQRFVATSRRFRRMVGLTGDAQPAQAG
jgi:methane/ammonia monooxygenase subunit A